MPLSTECEPLDQHNHIAPPATSLESTKALRLARPSYFLQKFWTQSCGCIRYHFNQIQVSDSGGLVQTGLAIFSGAPQVGLRRDQDFSYSSLAVDASQVQRGQLGCICGLWKNAESISNISGIFCPHVELEGIRTNDIIVVGRTYLLPNYYSRRMNFTVLLSTALALQYLLQSWYLQEL